MLLARGTWLQFCYYIWHFVLRKNVPEQNGPSMQKSEQKGDENRNPNGDRALVVTWRKRREADSLFRQHWLCQSCALLAPSLSQAAGELSPRFLSVHWVTTQLCRYQWFQNCGTWQHSLSVAQTASCVIRLEIKAVSCCWLCVISRDYPVPEQAVMSLN